MRILILFSGMKSTSEFPALKSKAVFDSFLPLVPEVFFFGEARKREKKY